MSGSQKYEGLGADVRQPSRSMYGIFPRGLVLAAALTLPWGIVAALRAAPIPSNAPPALDRFLSDVARATSPRDRVLVAGDLGALVFYRAAYRLYPRTVVGYLVRPYTVVNNWVGAPGSWPAAVRYAEKAHASYIALWGSQVTPDLRTIRFRQDGGVLAAARL